METATVNTNAINKVQVHPAISISLDHPTSGYGHFTVAGNGTLSIQTDYGSYDAAWRGQNDMVKFLAGCDVQYIMGNIERSFRNQVSRKKPEGIPQFHYKHLEVLVGAFLEALRELPAKWELKRTENLQAKDGRRVIETATLLGHHTPVEGETWYIYVEPATECFLIALNNVAEQVYCIPAVEAIKYLNY